MASPAARLDKWLCGRGFGTRSEAREAVRAGRVTVDGAAVSDPGLHVRDEAIRVDGLAVAGPPLLFVMNKPAGVLTAAADPHCPTVCDLLPDEAKRLRVMPVGRLDKDTTGVLLFTRDGRLAHRLIHPRRHVEKVYRATLARPVTPGDIAVFAQGVVLLEQGAETPCRPAKLEADGDGAALLTLTEGKYHQVKRMFAATGNRVLALERVRFGTVTLGGLPRGATRALTDEETAVLLRRVEEAL